MSSSEQQAAPPIDELVRTEVARTIQRAIKGVQYFSTEDPAVAQTPKDTIYRRGTLELHHYRPMTDEIYRVPLVLVMSLVSKAFIFDLGPGQSLVEFLVKKGYDVYLVDWGVPRLEDRGLKLDDYVLDFLPDCAARIAAECGEHDLTMIGYCMGGQLALMYAALHPLRNLVCLTTPINSEGMGLFRIWSDKRYFDVDRIVDTLGNVPAEVFYNSFQMLRPVQRMMQQVKLWDKMWDDNFVHSFRLLDRWGNDQIPFPGECFRQMTKEITWDNKLYKNELELGGRRVDLRNINASFLAVMAEHDHIVPIDSAKELLSIIGSTDKQEIVMKGGHVSVLAGANASKRLWPVLDRWLAVRSV
ncbi:MAG: alpha/beta fold hydrolase [Deltaproteobacteria bacterium]|nr:alpha/beta fold hydrolase [Deltaproteobacteria bacterium]